MLKKGRKSTVPELLIKIKRNASLPPPIKNKKYTFTKNQLIHLSMYIEELNNANTELKRKIINRGE